MVTSGKIEVQYDKASYGLIPPSTETYQGPAHPSRELIRGDTFTIKELVFLLYRKASSSVTYSVLS